MAREKKTRPQGRRSRLAAGALIALGLVLTGFFLGTIYFNSLARFTVNPVLPNNNKKLFTQFGQNLVTALILRAAGRRYRSLTLEADAHHLLTDVWTSAGVIVGLAAVSLTGWLWLDPVIALLVAGNILRIAWKLLYSSAQGLMDRALPDADTLLLQGVFDQYRAQGIEFHALRTRESGARRFIDVHVLVPGHWSVQHAHEVVEKIEADIRQALPQSTILTHLEPLEDPLSLADIALDR